MALVVFGALPGGATSANTGHQTMPARIVGKRSAATITASASPAPRFVTVVTLGGAALSSHAWYWTQSRSAGVDGKGNLLMYIWRTTLIELRVKGERKTIPVDEIRSISFFYARSGAGLGQIRALMALRTGEVIDGARFEAWSENKAYGDVHIVIPDVKQRISIANRPLLTDQRTFDQAPREITFGAVDQ